MTTPQDFEASGPKNNQEAMAAFRFRNATSIAIQIVKAFDTEKRKSWSEWNVFTGRNVTTEESVEDFKVRVTRQVLLDNWPGL